MLPAGSERPGYLMTLEEFLGEAPVGSANLPIGEILLKRGQVRRYQLNFILKLQQDYRDRVRRNIPLGELLVKHRAITLFSLDEALKLQKELPTESVTQIVSQLELEDDGEEATKLLPS